VQSGRARSNSTTRRPWCGTRETKPSEQEIYEYLSRVALGPEKLDDVFSIEGLATIPLFATANLLLSFCPRDKEWWEYLDQIWDAAEAHGIGELVLCSRVRQRVCECLI
jgi:hypothetical protein